MKVNQMMDLILNIIYVGSWGSVIFFLGLLVLAWTGIFAEVRDENGNFKRPFNWKAIFGFSIFIILFSSLLSWGNMRLISQKTENISLLFLWLNSFGIFMFLHLFDLIIIDYLLVVKWHPKFLNLPKTEYYTSMKPHIEGFYRGLIFGILISTIAALAFS